MTHYSPIGNPQLYSKYLTTYYLMFGILKCCSYKNTLMSSLLHIKYTRSLIIALHTEEVSKHRKYNQNDSKAVTKQQVEMRRNNTTPAVMNFS